MNFHAGTQEFTSEFWPNLNFPLETQIKVVLRLLFVLATEHTLLRIFLNIWRQILLLRDLHDAAF